MNILIYPDKYPELVQELFSLQEQDSSIERVLAISKLAEFNSFLMSQGTSDTICIIILKNTCDIIQFMLRKELFWRMETLILLDTDEELCLSLIHQLHPRFYGFVSDGFEHIVYVCRKLVAYRN